MGTEEPGPVRKPNRLRDYDYSRPGYYFVTICTQGHRAYLRRGAQCAPAPLPPLSEAGLAAENAILQIHSHYPNIRVDKYVIMPNHIHMILVFSETDGRTLCAPTLSRVIKQYKESITKKLGFCVWQRSFHDHVIRSEADYQRIWDYIETNPAKWREDCCYTEGERAMEPIISCCGVVCSACAYYPKDCRGCPEIEGRVFWLEYTGGEVCDIYACCVGEKKLPHCGRCAELPCARYDLEDPTKSHAENEAERRGQLELLRRL